MPNLKIEIYSKNNCTYCDSAKNLLKQKNYDYVEKSVEDPAVLAELLKRHSTARQMPQIFINNQWVGGYTGLQAAIKQIESTVL